MHHPLTSVGTVGCLLGATWMAGCGRSPEPPAAPVKPAATAPAPKPVFAPRSTAPSMPADMPFSLVGPGAPDAPGGPGAGTPVLVPQEVREGVNDALRQLRLAVAAQKQRQAKFAAQQQARLAEQRADYERQMAEYKAKLAQEEAQIQEDIKRAKEWAEKQAAQGDTPLKPPPGRVQQVAALVEPIVPTFIAASSPPIDRASIMESDNLVCECRRLLASNRRMEALAALQKAIALADRLPPEVLGTLEDEIKLSFPGVAAEAGATLVTRPASAP